MKNILFLNQKGGVGKSTLAVNTILHLAQEKKVQVFDCDPQASLVSFFKTRDEKNLNIDNIELDCPQIGFLNKKIEKIVNLEFDYCVIDTAGKADSEIIEVLKEGLIDLVIIPVQPSLFDIEASLSLLEKINEINNGSSNKINYKVLVNGAMTNSLSATKDVKEFLVNNNLNYFENIISYRKIYKDSLVEGKSIVEIDSENKKNIMNAKEEFFLFANELIDVLNKGN